jgi:hypothetical protein
MPGQRLISVEHPLRRIGLVPHPRREPQGHPPAVEPRGAEVSHKAVRSAESVIAESRVERDESITPRRQAVEHRAPPQPRRPGSEAVEQAGWFDSL